ncbi:MAG: hypothetical protein K2X27_08270, partial [Candidatus Obscuribacterales bacterium]|nr:hypothetical protein [Candidatus Obscuribacterales bacterium]
KVKTLLDSVDHKISTFAADSAKEALGAEVSAVADAVRAKELLSQQQAFIGKAVNITNPLKVAQAIGTEAEVASGNKLFVAGSAEAKTLSDFAKLSAANSKAVSAEKLAAAELERSQTMLRDATEGGAGSLLGRSFKGAATGLAIAGGSLAAGYALDKLGSSIFGYKAPETDGTGRFLMDGVAVPAILLSNMPARYKFGLAGAAFMSSRAADYFAGTGASIQMSALLRPNTCDGILITAAAMAPVDAKTKAALVGGAYLTGRLYNGVARLTGLDGGHPQELRDDFVNTFSHDQLTRSESSFDSAVAKGVKLGKENEAALELQMRDWLAKQNTTNPLSHMRGTATIAAALGQFRLEEGSRFDLASHADKKDRILKGANYDFGGEATTWLRMSAGSLVSAQNFAAANKGKTVDGQVMDDAYIQQLKNEQKKVEAQLELVYGKHDIPKIFDELKRQARVNSGDMQQALVRLKNQMDVLQTKDVRFMAKSSRDIAIGYLAEAAFMKEKGNGEEARIMFLAGAQYLQNAQRLDPNAPDNKALLDIQSTVGQGIPGAIDSQYKSNLNNPWQLNTPNYNDGLLRK